MPRGDLLGPTRPGRLSSGGHRRRAWFDQAAFQGEADFRAASFHGEARFDHVSGTIRAAGPATAAELAARLASSGRALGPATIQAALGELEAAGLAVAGPAVPARKGLPLGPAGRR